MKGLKFLLFLAIVFVLLVIFMLPFYYGDLSTLLSDLNNNKRTFQSIWDDALVYWENMDRWSALGFVFLASAIMIMHGVVDFFLLNKLNKFYSGTFILDGLLWLVKRLLSLVFTTLLFVFVANLTVDFHTNSWIYDDIEQVKEGKYPVLLLGTNKYLKDGVNENLYYTYRIDAVVELYKAGLISEIWISGDNSTKDYNEPLDMKKSLVAKGVPVELIKLDHAGFRTLDSIVRSGETFELNNLIIVSQGFHLQRALYLAQHFGIYAHGYEADGNMNMAMFIREHLAVPKMVLDLTVLNTQPKYGKTRDRRALNFSEKDVVLMSFVLVLFVFGSIVSYDAFDFGK